MTDTTTGHAGWDRGPDPTRTWAALREQVRTETDRACVAAATVWADRVWVAVHSGHLGPGPSTPTVPARDSAWYRIAIAGHQVLHDSGAYAHLAALRPRACAAAEPIIAAWLTSPPPAQDGQPADPEAVTVAQRLGVGDTVHVINGDTQIAHLSTVLHAAQNAAMFGIPGHRVDLTTPANRDGVTTVRVVVDLPTGLGLTSEPVRLSELIDPDATGVDAVTAALGRVARVATGLFTTYADTVWQNPPGPNAARVAGNAFADRQLERPATPPNSPTPPVGDSTADRDRRTR